MTITGTASVRNGVGGSSRTADFSLNLQVTEFIVTSYPIAARNIKDDVTIEEGEITVTPC